MTVRVVLVEDHALFRAGVRAELADRRSSARHARRDRRRGGDRSRTASPSIRATAPDVVLLDVHLPGRRRPARDRGAARRRRRRRASSPCRCPTPPRTSSPSCAPVPAATSPRRSARPSSLDAIERVARRRRRVLAAPRRVRARRVLRRSAGAGRPRARPAHGARAGGAAAHRPRLLLQVGELGGCPVPAGATGNIASEDLVSMLHEMGIETGIDARCPARRRALRPRGARPTARLAHARRRAGGLACVSRPDRQPRRDRRARRAHRSRPRPAHRRRLHRGRRAARRTPTPCDVAIRVGSYLDAGRAGRARPRPPAPAPSTPATASSRENAGFAARGGRRRARSGSGRRRPRSS